jgi:hypothetical protein
MSVRTVRERLPGSRTTQVFIADGRTASPGTPFCELTVPLK